MKKINPFGTEGTPRERGDTLIQGLARLGYDSHKPWATKDRCANCLHLQGAASFECRLLDIVIEHPSRSRCSLIEEGF